jgi:hypothetical protein
VGGGEGTGEFCSSKVVFVLYIYSSCLNCQVSHVVSCQYSRESVIVIGVRVWSASSSSSIFGSQLDIYGVIVRVLNNRRCTQYCVSCHGFEDYSESK